MQTVNKAMAGIVASLDKALSSNNMERIAGVMQQFEKQFENLDVQTDLVSGVMNQQAALSTPADDVRPRKLLSLLVLLFCTLFVCILRP